MKEPRSKGLQVVKKVNKTPQTVNKLLPNPNSLYAL